MEADVEGGVNEKYSDILKIWGNLHIVKYFIRTEKSKK